MITSPYIAREKAGKTVSKDTAKVKGLQQHCFTTSRNIEKAMLSLQTFDAKVIDSAIPVPRPQRMSLMPVQQPNELLSQTTTPGMYSEKSVPSTLMTSEITPDQ